MGGLQSREMDIQRSSTFALPELMSNKVFLYQGRQDPIRLSSTPSFVDFSQDLFLLDSTGTQLLQLVLINWYF